MDEPRKFYSTLSLSQRVLKLLESKEEYGGPQHVRDLCKNLWISNTNARSVVVRLHENGKIERLEKGVYRIIGDTRPYKKKRKYWHG